jgi:hypothetical protein
MSGQVRDKQLIPTAFGIADGKEIALNSLNTKVKTKLKSMGLTPAVISACEHLYDQALAGKPTFEAETGSVNSKDYNIILKDFGEITGAAWLLQTHGAKYKAVKFPVGNEKLIDYILVTKQGLDEKFSAKAGQGGKPSITSLMPVIEELIRTSTNLDIKLAKPSWVIYHLSTEEKNGLYFGPLKAAQYLNSPGWVALTKLLKHKDLKTGYTTGLPTQAQMEAAVVNMGTYENLRKYTKEFYDATGYTSTINVEVSKRIMGKGYDRVRYGLIHYPITAEMVKWLNTSTNNAQTLLNMTANTLNIQQVYMDLKGTSIVYSVKAFSDAEFKFGSPSSAPYPTNNRMGFTMNKSPQVINKIKD